MDVSDCFDDVFGGSKSSGEVGGKGLDNLSEQDKHGYDVKWSESPTAQPLGDRQKKAIPGDRSCCYSFERYAEVIGWKGAPGDA